MAGWRRALYFSSSARKYGSINLVLFPEMHRMKGFLIAAGIIGALYLADQQYAQGKYTSAVARMVTQMRHSFGV